MCETGGREHQANARPCGPRLTDAQPCGPRLTGAQPCGPRLTDAHLHLDFVDDPAAFAADAARAGLSMLAVGVTPTSYARVCEVAGTVPAGTVVPAVGLHPWWVADGRAGREDLAEFERLAQDGARFFGEVGLDFSPAHVPAGSEARQVEALERACRAAASASAPDAPSVISLHSVRAADATLDVLERTGALERCRCVFHWFSGTGDELSRAVRSGCWFSVNEMMLGTRRGREYARQVPEGRLLLETDQPAGEGVAWQVTRVTDSLEATLATLAQLRGHDVADVVRSNAEVLLG